MTTIKLKNGSGAPTTGDLVQGEPALDLTNKRLYTEDSGGTVIEVGTNPTSITTGDITATGTVSFAGLGTTGDVTFGDNDKAIFGVSSDLQIYHDGSNSYIEDTGSGVLFIKGTAGVYLRGKDSNEDLGRFLENGAVDLYFNGASRLSTTSTGIDVTGTVTADGLTVDGNATLQGASSPTLNITDTDTPTTAFISSTNSSARFGSSTNTDVFWMSNNTLRTQIDGATGDISFYDSSGSSQDLFWDASTSRLGLGTTSPSYVVHASTADNTIAQFQSTDNRGAILISDDDTNSYFGSEGGSTYISNAGGALSSGQLVIDSSGNVGIGRAPTAIGAFKIIEAYNNATSGGFFNAINNTGEFRFVKESVHGYFNMTDSGSTIFQSNGSERMRIDNSGHLIAPNGITLGTAVGTYAAANTLDDYEEGTFTPTIGGGTSNPTSVTYDGARYGSYIKVGKKVTVQIRMRTDAVSGGSGLLKIQGLPFTSASSIYGAVSVGYTASWSGEPPVGGYVNTGGDFAYLTYKTSVNGALAEYVQISDLNTGGNSNDLIMTITYETA